MAREQILANTQYLFLALSASVHATSQEQELNSFSQCLALSEHLRNTFGMNTWLPETEFMDQLILPSVLPSESWLAKRYAL